MPINWQDGSSGGTPLSAANLNRLAVVADLGTAGTPTGDAVRAAAAAQVTDTAVAQQVTSGATTGAALRAVFVPALPSTGSYTYNPDGTIASDPDGNSYTWNADGTPATQTKGGVTRTYHWNADGTLASVS